MVAGVQQGPVRVETFFRTLRNPRKRTPPTHATEARIERRTDHTGSRPAATRNHTGERGHTYMARKGYPHRGSRREHHGAARHHALTARRRPRPQQGPAHRHRKRKRARPQRPGLETRTPRTPARPTSPGGTPRPPQHGPSEPPYT